jgi:hypothetical protein
MKEIEFKITYNGEIVYGATTTSIGTTNGVGSTEIVRVRARDINSGFTKALKRARERLGNGRRREIATVEFWRVV